MLENYVSKIKTKEVSGSVFFPLVKFCIKGSSTHEIDHIAAKFAFGLPESNNQSEILGKLC